MSTLTFQLEEAKAGQLAEVARQHRGLEVEELLRQITDEFLLRPPATDAAFMKALADSTRENEELLRRLAK